MTLAGGHAIRRHWHNLVRLDPKTGTKTTAGTVPGVSGKNGEGGLLGLEISPTFSSDNWIYVYFTTSSDNRIARFKYTGGKLDTGSQQVLLKGILRNQFHNGGRLRFGPDGKLYAGVGDGENGNNAQDLNSLNGKILRLDPDGSVPSDNPFSGKYVWSYGHRNVEGLAFDSQGRLWEAELGNSVMDELNLVQKGGNYGWPSCEGTQGNCGGYVAPKQTWSTSQGGPSAIEIVNDWIYVAAVTGQRLYVAQINSAGTGTSAPQAIFAGKWGRLRTVVKTPDGGLWVTSTNNDMNGGTPSVLDNVIVRLKFP